jgi:peptidoglycan/LPS O-acetylase OafA/YrhL
MVSHRSGETVIRLDQGAGMNHQSNQGPQRLPVVDALKAIGAQLIVLHHLAAYGPMSDHAYALLPGVIDWLYDYARIAVQVFLVSGGFLAARSLAPDGRLHTPTPLLLLLRRYITLVIPYLAAIGIAIGCAVVARAWMDHDSIPAAPTVPQVVAHALLLHGVLGVDSLSAGVWYVAIDFQLFALLLALLWLGRRWLGDRAGTISVVLVTSLVAASLYVFNRNPDWDDWGHYFFGAYGLGVLAFWASGQPRAPWWLAALALFAVPALAMDFRSRIALALVVALTLGLARYRGNLTTWHGPSRALGSYFSRISYSLFLIHFPIALLINAGVARWGGTEPAVNLSGLIFAWIGCNIAGVVFYHLVEHRTRTWSERITQPLSRSRAPMAGHGYGPSA